MTYRYQLIQDGMVVASVDAPKKEQAEREINHYAFMYRQDGPVEIKDVTRRLAKGRKGRKS